MNEKSSAAGVSASQEGRLLEIAKQLVAEFIVEREEVETRLLEEHEQCVQMDGWDSDWSYAVAFRQEELEKWLVCAITSGANEAISSIAALLVLTRANEPWQLRWKPRSEAIAQGLIKWLKNRHPTFTSLEKIDWVQALVMDAIQPSTSQR